MIETTAIDISDPSGTSEARRAATGVALRQGFDEQDRGRIALVVTELATNLVKHARGGTLVFTGGGPCGGRLFQAVSIDSGPGFDLTRSLRDGHSTTGSPGSGLGAITRLSSAFDAYALPGKGSVVFAEIRDRHTPQDHPDRLDVAGISVPKEGEEECGDAWAALEIGDAALVLVADGIGHGPDAAAAAHQAVRSFGRSVEADPAAIVEQVHAALRSTRGATVAVAVLDFAASRLRYAGIGNIGAAIAGGGPTRRLVSHNGTAGHEARKIQEFAYPWPSDGLLIMSSDGLGTRWDLDAYPGLSVRHPAVIAGVLYRDFSRRRDDVTVVVGRAGRRPVSKGVE